jgi:hypothetical protein
MGETMKEDSMRRLIYRCSVLHPLPQITSFFVSVEEDVDQPSDERMLLQEIFLLSPRYGQR